ECVIDILVGHPSDAPLEHRTDRCAAVAPCLQFDSACCFEIDGSDVEALREWQRGIRKQVWIDRSPADSESDRIVLVSDDCGIHRLHDRALTRGLIMNYTHERVAQPSPEVDHETDSLLEATVDGVVTVEGQPERHVGAAQWLLFLRIRC